MLIHTHNSQTCVIHWYILYDNLTAKIIITINNNALTFLLCFIFRQHVFHEVNILEHNAELSTVKTVQVQQLSMPSIQEFGQFKRYSDAGQHV